MNKFLAIPAMALGFIIMMATAAFAWHPETGATPCTVEQPLSVISITNPAEWWAEGSEMYIESNLTFDKNPVPYGQTATAKYKLSPGHYVFSGRVYWKLLDKHQDKIIEDQPFSIELDVPVCEVPTTTVTTPVTQPPSTTIVETKLIPPVVTERPQPPAEEPVAVSQPVLAFTGSNTSTNAFIGVVLVLSGVVAVVASRRKAV